MAALILSSSSSSHVRLLSNLCYISLIFNALIIQLPRAYGIYNFNVNSERQIFEKCFYGQEYSREIAGFSERKYERKYFDSYWNRTRDLWHDRPALSATFALLILCQKLLLFEKTNIPIEKLKPRCYSFI